MTAPAYTARPQRPYGVEHELEHAALHLLLWTAGKLEEMDRRLRVGLIAERAGHEIATVKVLDGGVSARN